MTEGDKERPSRKSAKVDSPKKLACGWILRRETGEVLTLQLAREKKGVGAQSEADKILMGALITAAKGWLEINWLENPAPWISASSGDPESRLRLCVVGVAGAMDHG